jgi:phenylacetate-CoA ligase
MSESRDNLPSSDEAVELSVIVPCLNEELNIPELAARILRVFELGGFRGELVMVDDGSTDGTAAAIRALMQAHPGVVVGCNHPQNRGIAAGWRTGAAVARGKLVAIIDADLQYQPEDLLRLRRELYDHSVDIVQGWRSAVGRRRDRRYTLSRGLNHLLNATFGMDLKDNKSGFIMCGREVFQDLLTYKGSYFYWQSFIMVAAHAKGYSYKEVETLFEQRRQGVSFLETTAQIAAAKNLFDLAKAAWEYRVTSPPADIATHFLRRYPIVDRSPERDPLTALKWRTYLASFGATHWRITRGVEHYYETLRKTQWLSIERTVELQNEKLRRLMRHCYRNVPYYRAQMRALNIRPEDIRDKSDLQKLPVLSKDDIRRHLYFDIMSENHEKSLVYKLATSGATGEPMSFYADRAQLEFRWAASLRAAETAGYRFGSPIVELWPEAFDLGKPQLAMAKAEAVLANRTRIPVFELSEATLDDTLQAISRAEPLVIEGYAEALDRIATHINEKGQGSLTARPRAVLTNEQTLTPESRRNIERAFGCKVFDKYVSREFSTIAHECEAHEGHHVVAEGYIVEILRENGEPARSGEVGDIVITDLNNYCMPFIRYRIGDRAEALDPAAPCSCGRGSPRIGAVLGRRQSIIVGEGGRFVPGTFFFHYLRELDYAIQRFRVTQEAPGAMKLQIVKGGRFSQDILDEALATFRRHLGEGMRIDVEITEDGSLEGAALAVQGISTGSGSNVAAGAV